MWRGAVAVGGAVGEEIEEAFLFADG